MLSSNVAPAFIRKESVSPLPGTETILIVDDEHAVLGLTHLMLRRSGYALIPASSGKEALHLFEVWPDLEVDLLMADIVMPGMNGVELAEEIRVLRPNLPVLFFSAYSDQEILRPVIARRVPYIAKPFTALQLTKKIREVLDKPKTASKGSAGT
jgi:two-component system cell cycle sensor histidine kinase/response regulator CckA